MIQSIRKLARSYKYQFLYSKVKEIANLHLFKNFIDLSKAQVNFLQWLEVYKNLYQELQKGEDYLSEEVLEDDLRTDAYLYYKSQVKNTDKKSKPGQLEVDKSPGATSIIFKRK